MKRWIIENPNNSHVIYYKDLATAKEKNPNAVSIKECTDYSYLEYVHKIISCATEKLHSDKGKTIYKIPYNSAYVLVQLWCDMVDDKPFYYDGLQFQNHDIAWVAPTTWEMSNPKDFCERFLSDAPVALPIEIISLRELKALKPIKFWFKNNNAYYKDENGYFYYIWKPDMPNKKSREEYDKFKGNDNAVLVEISTTHTTQSKWYSSESEFQSECKKNQSTHTGFPVESCEIKKRGYRKLPPEERKIAIRLPYFRLEHELKYENCTHRTAHKWCAMMQGYTQFGDDPFMNIDWVQDLIERWISYNENPPVKRRRGTGSLSQDS